MRDVIYCRRVWCVCWTSCTGPGWSASAWSTSPSTPPVKRRLTSTLLLPIITLRYKIIRATPSDLYICFVGKSSKFEYLVLRFKRKLSWRIKVYLNKCYIYYKNFSPYCLCFLFSPTAIYSSSPPRACFVLKICIPACLCFRWTQAMLGSMTGSWCRNWSRL